MRSTSVDNIERKQKREARLVNKFPLNQAALRWLKEVEKDDDLCDAGEIDTEAHVVTYLVWALEWLRGQELLDDWRAEWMQEEQTSLFEISPVAQTRYFLRPISPERPAEYHLTLARKLSEADNLQKSASLVVELFDCLLDADQEEV